MLFFVLAIVGMLIGYKQHDNPHKVFGAAASSRDVLSQGSQSSSQSRDLGLSRAFSSTSTQVGITNNVSSTSTSSDEFYPSGSQNETSSSSASDPLMGEVSQDEKVKFKDVTTSAYKNLRLGFVMELPADWRLFYEHSDGVLFVSDAVTSGTSVDDVRRTPKAMWISVSTICQSADATSTSFALVNASTTPTRERYACVPPFKINMGLRGDQSNVLDRQAFLLDIERTIYPIVR